MSDILKLEEISLDQYDDVSSEMLPSRRPLVGNIQGTPSVAVNSNPNAPGITRTATPKELRAHFVEIFSAQKAA